MCTTCVHVSIEVMVSPDIFVIVCNVYVRLVWIDLLHEPRKKSHVCCTMLANHCGFSECFASFLLPNFFSSCDLMVCSRSSSLFFILNSFQESLLLYISWLMITGLDPDMPISSFFPSKFLRFHLHDHWHFLPGLLHRLHVADLSGLSGSWWLEDHHRL